jgi:hypothetical protein
VVKATTPRTNTFSLAVHTLIWASTSTTSLRAAKPLDNVTTPTARATEMIKVLNLGDREQNNRLLIEKRKQLAHALMQTDGLDPFSPLEDDDLLESLIDDLNNPIDGKLQPFAPVVSNILRGWLAT